MSKNIISLEEAVEIEKFKLRKKSFFDLPVTDVHNIPSMFPNMYKRMFNSNNTNNDLFCIGSARLCDADENVVQLYEKCLVDGYEIKQKELFGSD